MGCSLCGGDWSLDANGSAYWAKDPRTVGHHRRIVLVCDFCAAHGAYAGPTAEEIVREENRNYRERQTKIGAAITVLQEEHERRSDPSSDWRRYDAAQRVAAARG